jgi:hypothetical protein
LPARLHFLRFEFKYVLGGDLRREVERELGYFMQLDPFVLDADRKYFVRSLYFDSPDYAHYFEKVDGELHRAKFRLRTYARTPQDQSTTFLELKGRHDAMVFKRRAIVAGGERFAPGPHGLTAAVLAHTTPGEVLDRFHYDLERRRLRPAMLVDYHRRPYVSKYDPSFRLTMDDGIRATRTRALFPGPGDGSRAVLSGYTVMEVKFRHHVPSWFHRILQSYDLRRQSVSKVCKAMEAWRLHPDMEF